MHAANGSRPSAARDPGCPCVLLCGRTLAAHPPAASGALVLPAAPAHTVCVFEQNHLAVFSVLHPLAPSISSSVASSLASSTGSGSSSPTALPALPARALPLDPAGNTVEAVLGKSALRAFHTVSVVDVQDALLCRKAIDMVLLSLSLNHSVLCSAQNCSLCGARIR